MAHHALTPKNVEIRDNFDAIAPRYDLTNRVISFGVDRRWRRVAVRRLGPLPPEARVLDLACGTCDLALAVLRRHPGARVAGADLSRTMLGLAKKKLRGRRARGAGAGAADAGRAAAGDPLALVNAPAEALPFLDGSFDAVTIGFGIRNVPDFREGLREMARVLRPGGKACILEFSTPPSRLLWRIYNYYFFKVLPRVGGWLTGREAAYRYLTRSVSAFPGPADFGRAMEECGFRDVSWNALNGGIVCVHTGVRA